MFHPHPLVCLSRIHKQNECWLWFIWTTEDKDEVELPEKKGEEAERMRKTGNDGVRLERKIHVLLPQETTNEAFPRRSQEHERNS